VIITTDNDPSTNLPLEIIDEPKILENYQKNYTKKYWIKTAEFLNYNGRIGIEIRGFYSTSTKKNNTA
jgi:hypothetical protein